MTPSRNQSLLSPERLTRFGMVVAAGMVIALMVITVTADGTAAIAGGRLGGDWAPFRTAGVLARQDPVLLLDPAAQRATMAQYLDGDFAPFPYPPVFAFLFVPFSLVGFEAGYLLYVMVLVAAGLVAVAWTMDVLRVAPDWRAVGLLGGITYPGTFASWGGAQNATITLLLLAGCMRLLDRGKPVAAGAVLTLLWFKPQFAIPVLGLLFVGRHVRAVVTAIAGGVVLGAAHVVIFGWDWHRPWLELLSLTDEGNRIFNTANTVSPVEWLRGLLDAPWGDVVGLSLAVLLGAMFIWLAHRRRGPADLLVLIGLALVMTAPHALRYELTLLVPAIGVLTRTRGIIFGLAAWAGAAVMVADVPPLLRIAYVAVIGGLWIWEGSGMEQHTDQAKPGVLTPRTTDGRTIGSRDQTAQWIGGAT